MIEWEKYKDIARWSTIFRLLKSIFAWWIIFAGLAWMHKPINEYFTIETQLVFIPISLLMGIIYCGTTKP